jgi:POT family proton-dependent oligopeptide transporter
VIGLLIYLVGLRELPPDEWQKAKAAHTEHNAMSRDEWRAIFALLILFLPNTLFWATYEQQGNTVALWADGYTDRSINLLFWQGDIPVTWFQAFNPFMIFTFTPLIVGLWAIQSRRGREPSTVTKMAMGCFIVALAYLLMVAAALYAGPGEKSSWAWLFAFFAIITVGELYLSPVGLSLVSKVAPARILSMMMGVWLSTSFLGNFMAGWLGSYWSSMEKPNFFLMIAGVAAAAGVSIILLNRPLRKSLQH